MSVLPVREALPVASADAAESGTERLARLFDSHFTRLHRLARRLTSGPDDALDLVQETFLRAARSAGAIPTGVQREEAWLVRVLVNIRRDEWRKQAVRERHRATVDRESVHVRDDDAAFVAHATVWRALDTLSPRRRAVLVMRELEELAIPSIAALLGITPITVRWHLVMARRDLAKALAPRTGR